MKMIKKLNFDICTHCNHACTFCSNPDKRTIKDKVSANDFEKVMANVMKYVDADELGLSAKGEVLINKDISQIIKLAKNVFNINYIYISTNGALLSKKMAVELLDAGLDSIKFSINGWDQKSYKDTHKKDDFEKVINNFKELLILKKERFPKLKIMISSIVNMSKEDVLLSCEKLFGDDYMLIDNINKYNISFTSKSTNFDVDMTKIKPCPLALDEIYIDSDCRLGLCCKDYFKEFDYGSLLSNDFLSLYDSKKFTALRKMHVKKKFPKDHFCKKCLIFNGEA